MTINAELFKAILAMDAYNRGYGEGIILPSVPNVTQIGNATIIQQSDTEDGDPGVAAGFYAIAYTLGGQKIISYRGTNADSIPNFAIDAFYGYGIGAGANSATQGNLAIDFYKAVAAAQSVAPHDANIVLTGHSLGGGLAGYIGGLYGKYVSIFDNMTYENSVNGAFTVASNPTAYATLIHPMTGMPYIDSGRLAFAQSLSNNIYGGATPWDPVFTGIAWYVEGELLDNLLPARDSQYLSPVFINSYGGTRNSIALHDMALLVTLRYAEINYGITIADWHAVGEEFINSLFNDTLAAAAGFDSLGGVFGDAQKMRNAIAYSAIDEGTRPFGDTAIRAMFNDANELGKVFGATGSSAIIAHYADSISNIFTQFAGKLAIDKVLQSSSSTAIDGVLKLSANGLHLDINFANPLWAATTDIIGRTQLFNNIFVGNYSPGANINASMQNLWGDSSNKIFDHVVLATKNTGGTIVLSNAPSSTKANLLAGSLGVDVVTGSSGKDLLLGYDGNDILNGGGGKDILLGGDGNDTLNGGTGADIIDGGTGTDTVSYATSTAAVTIDLALTTGQSGGDAIGDILSNIENIIGSFSNDTITGNGSANLLTGGTGNDILTGGAGDDKFYYASFTTDGKDTITDPQPGDRIMYGTSAFSSPVSIAGDELYGSGYVRFQRQGRDLFISDSIGSILVKDFFPNGYDGTAQYTNMGITIPIAATGYDAGIPGVTVNGSGGNDTLSGTNKNDIINGLGGNDKIYGGNGNDAIYGGTGDDYIEGGYGYDTIDGGGGNDTIYGERGRDTINGGEGDDTIYGGSGRDTINGGGGNDTIWGGQDADIIDGGSGIDTIYHYNSGYVGVYVDLNLTTPQQSGAEAMGDILLNIENIVGSSYNDTLIGNSIANILSGAAGHDTLTGWAGADTLIGGNGNDIFRYTAITDSGVGSGLRDIISDFVRGSDKVDLSDFAGTFNFNGTGAFTGTAHEVNYTQVSGNTILGMDADGNGILDFQIELAGLHTMAASDFLL